MRLIIFLAIITLILSACTSQVEKQEDNTAVPLEEEQHSETLKVIEVQLDENGFFHPDTIIVKEGEKVRLQFMNTDIFTFSIPDMGITESVSDNFIDVAGTKGDYLFECADCEQKNPGLLKVV